MNYFFCRRVVAPNRSFSLAYALLAALSTPALAQPGLEEIAPDRVSAATPDASLPTIEVLGQRPSHDYQADEVSGTKTGLPLRELPQAVRVMSRQTLDDVGAVRLDDALDYVGGVSRQNHFGGLWDNIAIRGFAGHIDSGLPMLLNGFSGNRGFNAPRDIANIERIEFLKGPAASLYGTSEPGGTVNIVTKKPLWKTGYAIEGYVASHDLYRTAIDLAGPVADSFAYRLNTAIEDRGSFRDHVKTRRTLFAPAFAWKLSPFTTLDYSGEVLRHRTPLDRGVVAINNQLAVVPRERFLGEVADGDIRMLNQTHQVVLSHAMNADWSGRLGLSYKTGTLEGHATEPQPALQSDRRTLRRQRRFRDYSSRNVALQGELRGSLRIGGVDHELLLGAETYRFVSEQVMLRVNPTASAPYAIDVLNPVYGQPQPVPLPSIDTREKQRNAAFYLQDTLELGTRWRLFGGVRFDRYGQTFTDRRAATRARQNQSATSPRFGISYLPDNQWTLFASVGKSFRPNSGLSATGMRFDPESGRAFEIGSKWENANKTFGGTLALYDIEKNNVLTADPRNPNFSIATGKVRSRGLDIDISGQIARAWRINASFSYIDASVRKDNMLEVGGRLLNIPRVNGSVLVIYSGALGANGQYGLGGGLVHTGKRLGEERTQAQADAGAPAFELPRYTLAKALAYWRVHSNLRFSLDVDNLFDKTYYSDSFQSTWVAPGAARTITFGVQAKF
jgi:iron complex outermembrane receptor protein